MPRFFSFADHTLRRARAGGRIHGKSKRRRQGKKTSGDWRVGITDRYRPPQRRHTYIGRYAPADAFSFFYRLRYVAPYISFSLSRRHRVCVSRASHVSCVPYMCCRWRDVAVVGDVDVVGYADIFGLLFLVPLWYMKHTIRVRTAALHRVAGILVRSLIKL